jgi:hypothetical protein
MFIGCVYTPRKVYFRFDEGNMPRKQTKHSMVYTEATNKVKQKYRFPIPGRKHATKNLNTTIDIDS